MDQENERQRIKCSDCGADIPNDGNCWYCENEPKNCNQGDHEFTETYYGCECNKCGLFFLNNSNFWAPI